jgi:hypothetical protein
LFDYFMEKYNNDKLKQYVALCGGGKSLTRKADRAEFLAKTLSSGAEVRRLWNDMDDLSRKAVASAYHNDGAFVPDAFVAQYGSLPPRPKQGSWSWYSDPILMDLFIQDNTVFPEIMPLLAPLVPLPDRFQLVGNDVEPSIIVGNKKKIPCTVAQREQTGRHDLLVFLSLLAKGALKLSDSSSLLTPKGVNTLLPQLSEGDFVEDAQKAEETILCFGLTAFALQAGFINKNGSVTDLAKRYLANEDPTLLFHAFEQWSEQGEIDEIKRIDTIRGLRARGVRLTPPSERRQRIVEALSWCPAGVWISVQDFYRAVKIWHFDFEIEQGGLDKLYVGYSGSYRYEYSNWAPPQSQWLLTNGLYINVVLWEILASIGALDIAYVEDAEGIFQAKTYNYDELIYSRYDGLTHFRINPLGAYLFGQADVYKPAQSMDAPPFSVTAEGRVKLLKPEALSAAHRTQLEAMADPVDDDYQISTQKLLTLLEMSPNLDLPLTFLEQRNQGPLPNEIYALFKRIDADSTALRIRSNAFIIRVRSSEVATAVLNDLKAGAIAQRLDDRTLVIPANKENAFRDALRQMGYGLAK